MNSSAIRSISLFIRNNYLLSSGCSATIREQMFLIRERFIMNSNKLAYGLSTAPKPARGGMTPTRDKEALQTMIRKLGMAMFMEKEAVVTVWTDVEDQTIQGMITKLDKERKSIKIENEKEYTWVPFDHVLSIEIVQTEVQ